MSIFQGLYDSYDAKFRTAKSFIDKENNQIVLRSTKYPEKGGNEWIISSDIVKIVETPNFFGKVTEETFPLNGVFYLKLKQHGSSFVSFEIHGRAAKRWTSGMNLSLLDVFVAYAAITHIYELANNDDNFVLLEVDPSIIDMRRRLDTGEIDEEIMNTLREKGVFENMGFVEPEQIATSTPNPTSPEAPISQEPSGQSVADELLKLKNLVDLNVITQEEFEHKKKKLLVM